MYGEEPGWKGVSGGGGTAPAGGGPLVGSRYSPSPPLPSHASSSTSTSE